jgi:hypothetical protein
MMALKEQHGDRAKAVEALLSMEGIKVLISMVTQVGVEDNHPLLNLQVEAVLKEDSIQGNLQEQTKDGRIMGLRATTTVEKQAISVIGISSLTEEVRLSMIIRVSMTLMLKSTMVLIHKAVIRLLSNRVSRRINNRTCKKQPKYSSQASISQ